MITTKNQKLKMALTSTPMILIYVMVVFCLIAAIRQPAFISPATAINLGRAGIFTMCFAICEMVVIISGGIDVSFPAIGCVAMYVPMYMYYHEMLPDNAVVFFLLSMFIGLVFGILNGVLVSYLRLPPLIATLATSSIASGGLVMALGTREFTTLPPSLQSLYEINMITYMDPATGFTYPLTVLFLVPVILCVVMALVLRYTMLGRGLYAIGGDQNAARIAGFNVRRLQFFSYIFCGVMTGATALIYTTRMNSSTTRLRSPWEATSSTAGRCRQEQESSFWYTSALPENCRRINFCPVARWRISRTLPRGLSFRTRTRSYSRSSASSSQAYIGPPPKT